MYTNLYELFGRFIPLDENDKQILQESFEPQSVKKKHQLLEYGKVANHFYFINDGLLRLYGHNKGEEKTLFFFKENMVAGSIESYLTHTPSELILEALEDTQLLVITGEGLEELYDTSIKFSKAGLLLTQHRLAALMKFFTSFVFDSPEARYQDFLKNHPDLIQRVPQHIIASFLGVTPVSLSRIRKRISNQK
jgi:CRP-like cAMP-binding protein